MQPGSLAAGEEVGVDAAELASQMKAVRRLHNNKNIKTFLTGNLERS